MSTPVGDYSTREPCVRGHTSPRRKWGHCRACMAENRAKQRMKNRPFGQPPYKFDRWPPAVLMRVREMAPTMSSSEIAKALGPGYTKNSVIGKCYRANIKLGGW